MSRIHAHIEIDGRTVQIGDLYSTLRRGRLSSTFVYDADYLGRKSAYSVEPALPLSGGNWALDRALPRSFDDAAPDRWGRNLIAKRLRAEAAIEGLAPRQIDDRDFLLGVSDATRQGALRFTTETGDAFEHPSTSVPKLIALPALLNAADSVARDPDSLTAIKTLLDAGTGSLGGARPKASVRDGERLLIAKFPHHGDEWAVIGWEKTALDLAEDAGITVPNTQLVAINGKSVLLLERFDRNGPNRVGYISAMTLIEGEDGSARDYLEIAEGISEHGARTRADLHELWRRIAFSVAIHNTDDHLRNHGFLRRGPGWVLSPAFDINPNPVLGAHRVTSIGGAQNPIEEIDALLAVASSFDLSGRQARQILREVADAATRWTTVARRNGIVDAEIQRFRAVFDETIGIVATAGAIGREPSGGTERATPVIPTSASS